VQPEHQAFTLQDATRGLYVVDSSVNRPELPAIGEFVEVEGTTDPGLFAPFVKGSQVRSLGTGHLPEPVKPTWDQLLNGSLDAQYVELRGIITALQPEGVILLTREGRIKIELRATGLGPEALARFDNALVRIRGCLFATWDYLTHQVKVGEIRVYDADVTVERPAPEDALSAPRKAASELLLFDPNAGAFQRVQVAGQIVHIRGEEHFLMDGPHGLRFLTKAPSTLAVGDVVEVAGFPELSSSASPILREALARRVGHKPLPPPRHPPSDDLLRAEHDATRVQIEGSLMSTRRTGEDTMLEMQSGKGAFVARLTARDEAVMSLPVGSRLRLTGIYAALGGPRMAGRNIVSFELLLNSAGDVRVLTRPPWWTLGRLLVIVGALACALTLAALWITQLRRQVVRRTTELETQMRERQRVEQQHAMEQERARIARDLHDDLGSGITEISMLATRARSATAPDETRARHLDQVGAKAREMVTVLDEIVWAMNPQHDSLASLVSYFSLYADRFLGLANIAWRLEEPIGPGNPVIDSRHRHQLFLAFKEALTNVVRHSGASEVRVRIQLEAGEVRLLIADNGRGLSPDSRRDEMDGVANMRSRLEKLGGRFETASEAGRGTRLLFCLPANGVEEP
jgi:signal transduction histidine kinase